MAVAMGRCRPIVLEKSAIDPGCVKTFTDQKTLESYSKTAPKSSVADT
jgi:hypothetical protein